MFVVFEANFVVTRGSWSFKTMNFEVFKTKHKELLVSISSTLFTDTRVTYASIDQLLCFNSIYVVQNLQFYEKRV